MTKISEKQLEELSVSRNYLESWYIDSIDETIPPCWTEEHITELMCDFWLIPKRIRDCDREDNKVKQIMDNLNNHIKRIVRDQLHTLCGEEQSFPSSPTRYNRTKFETLADKDMLTEGLIRTYPMEWVEKYISSHITSDFVKGYVDYDKMQFWFILKQDSKSIEPLKKKMETFGYFCSVEDNVCEGVYLQFEPKFDIYRKGSEFSSRNNGIVFYHVAPIRFKKKILNVGLIPKAKNKYLKYPDRIYLMLSSEGKDNAYDMADMLYTQDENTLNQGKYSLFGVTVDGLDNVKFYPDRNTPHVPSYFTYENIPSKNISFIEDFDAYKF